MHKESTERLLYFLIWGIALFGVFGAFGLVQAEFTQGNICPKVLGIPACYIIMTCLLMVLLSHANVLKDKDRLYFIGVGIALSIATFGSVSNVLDYVECPKTEGGTPMCYLSFLLFFSLLVLKLVFLKRHVN